MSEPRTDSLGGVRTSKISRSFAMSCAAGDACAVCEQGVNCLCVVVKGGKVKWPDATVVTGGNGCVSRRDEGEQKRKRMSG